MSVCPFGSLHRDKYRLKNSLVLACLGLLKISSGAVSSKITPPSMKMTRLDTSRTNAISCVTTSIVKPSPASRFITSSTSPTISGSSALVGSSKRIISGFIESVRAKLPELPDQKAARFAEQFGLSAYDARQLVEGEQTASFFEKCMEAAGADARKLAKPVANLVINDIAGWQNANEDANLADSPLSPERAVELIGLLAEDAISSKQAKEVFAAVMDEDKDPAAIVEERGMKQVSDTGAIEAVVDAVIAANPDEVARYKDGNTKVIGFFVGQCMKQMRGQGNPKVINQLLAKKLAE